MCKCQDVYEERKFISMLHNGKSLNQKVTKGENRSHVIIKDAWKNLKVSLDRKDAEVVTIFKKGDRLQQLPRDLASLYTKENVHSHTANKLSTQAEDFLSEAK